VLGDGPGVQQRPLQHTLLGGQHFGALPVPQQLWLLLQHIFPLQQLWLLLQHWLPHAVWFLGQVTAAPAGPGSGLPEPQDALPKPRDA